MKKFIALLFFILATQTNFAQEKFKEIYNHKSDAMQDVTNAIKYAKKKNKHIFLIIGFNKCPWCQIFHKFINTDYQIDSLLNANFLKVMINYNHENKNMELMKKLEYPNRFGFPVFVILNKEGKKLHTQNSAYLEENKGYNKKEILKFLKQWSPAALDDKN